MYTVADIAKLIGGTLEGGGTVQLQDFAGIEQAKAGDLSFLANVKYESFLYMTYVSAIFVDEKFTPTQPCPTTLIRVTSPYGALSQLVRLYVSQQEPHRTGVHPTVIVDPSVTIPKECTIDPCAYIKVDAKLGEQVVISTHCVTGTGYSIGDHATLHPRVMLYSDNVTGHHCHIHTSTVIGVGGFGFAPTEHDYDKILQMGHVEMGGSVEIGTSSYIDRATMGVTHIASGVRIDNLVQVAHNCTVDEHTVIAARAGLAGSAHTEGWCQLSGQVGIASHLTVGDHSQLGDQTGVLGNLQSHSAVTGAPAMPVGKALRAFAMLPKPPELVRRIDKLEEQSSSETKWTHL